MPVTPFHFGPGALIAVAAPRSVSFLAFCAANVLIDVESLYNMVTRQPRIHTFFHTYVGATLIAIAITATFVPLRLWASRLPDWPVFAWRRLSLRAVALGAGFGAWTHVLLDSIMHGDITPLAPFSTSNGMYQAVSLGVLHLGCLAAAGLAFVWWCVRANRASYRAGES